MSETILHEYAEVCGHYETEMLEAGVYDDDIRVWKCKGNQRIEITAFCTEDELACFRQMHETELENWGKDRFERKARVSAWK